MNEDSIFAEAIAIESAEQRDQFLDSACADNLELRQAVEKLLKLSDHVGSFLEHPALEGQVLKGHAVQEINPAIICDTRSTRVEQCQASTPGNAMNENLQQPDEETLRAYLKPANRENSLGRLGHYEILNVVGNGAFGTVLRAFDTKLERIVAIKLLALKMSSMSPARKRFLREARTSAQIRHENVVSIHSVEEDPIPYLVMEYIPGRTLQQQLEEHGPLDLPSALRLGKQIADGLAAAHARDLIHRDIKPGNILLEGDMEERVKITDFGLARTVDDASMSQSGMIAGTPMYMAPEQAHGYKLDQRADLFSLGSVLYQMISGRPPFRAPTAMAVLNRVTGDTPRPIQEIIPETPDWICELIGRLHAKNPAERFSSAREVSELLARCADDLQAGRTPKIPVPSKSAAADLVEVSKNRPRHRVSLLQSPLAKIAAAIVIMLGLLGTTEATGVTELASTVIRLTTGSGTLVIETDDPGVEVVIDGQDVTITGAGVEELTLRPGEYEVAALKDGQRVKQELVSITRNGRTVVRMSLEPAATPPSSTITRSATDWHGWPADAPPPAIVPFDAEQAKSYQKAWAKYVEVPVEYVNSIGMTFRLIPAGEFMMGSSQEEIERLLAEAKAQKHPDWFSDKIPAEGPQHKVTLTRPYSLSIHPVTRGQFRRFVEATGYKTDAEEDGKGGYGRRKGQWVQDPKFLWNARLGFEREQTDEHPVVNVSWNDAVAFCKWLSKETAGTYRLPTEAEWEFACRAGNPGRFSFGDDESKLANYAWYGGHGGLGTKPAGQKARNAFGLFDMHGNVWEWCDDGFALYSAGHQIDPIGTNRFQLRVARGGAFSTQPSAVRSARRSDGTPTTRYVVNGFRVLRVAERVNRSQDQKTAPGSTSEHATGHEISADHHVETHVNVLFQGPTGAKLTLDKDPNRTILAPGRLDVRPGRGQGFVLSEIPGHESSPLDGWLELAEVNSRTESYLEHNAISVVFTREEIEEVQARGILTKVIYLTRAKSRQSGDVRVASQTLSGSALNDDVVTEVLDLVAEARQKGDVLAVLRLSEPALVEDRHGVVEHEDAEVNFQNEIRPLQNLRVNRKPTVEEANTIVERLLATYPDREATIHGQAAHLFGQSGIQEFSDEVRKHALESIKSETDIVERARMFMYLSNAEEVQDKPSEASYWASRGLLELQPLDLPKVAPDPPGVGHFNDLVANPGDGDKQGTKQELYQRLSAAEKQARDTAIQVQELVRFRNIYVDALRRLNTTTEAREQLQKMAQERIGSDWLQGFLETAFDRDREVTKDFEKTPDDESPGSVDEAAN